MNKWERQPLRVGMLLGFVLIPLLGILHEFVLLWVTGHSASFPLWVTGNSASLPYLILPYEFMRFFIPGAFYGAILGGNALSAWSALRKGNYTHARWQLGISGGIIFLASLYSLHVSWLLEGRRSMMPQTYGVDISDVRLAFLISQLTQNLPLFSGIFMMALGLLMRSKR